MSIFSSTSSFITAFCLALIFVTIAYRYIVSRLVQHRRDACVFLLQSLYSAAEDHIQAHGEFFPVRIVTSCTSKLSTYQEKRTLFAETPLRAFIGLGQLQGYMLGAIAFLADDARATKKDVKQELFKLVHFELPGAVRIIDCTDMLSRAARQLIEHTKSVIENSDLTKLESEECTHHYARLALLELKLKHFKMFT